VKRTYLTVKEAAAYLGMPEQELVSKARRGDLPVESRGDRWVFNKEDIDHWTEQRIGTTRGDQLRNIERTVGRRHGNEPFTVQSLLRPDSIVLDLDARTRASVLRGLVACADRTGLVYDTQALLELVEQREEMIPTAIEGGVAIPHPRRPDPYLVEESLIVFARTARGVPFGAPDGALTDLFFLIVSREDRFHLTVLARLTRMLSVASFRDELRLVEEPDDALSVIDTHERDVLTR
jgi:PTS system nitrogen regulatory IIA component